MQPSHALLVVVVLTIVLLVSGVSFEPPNLTNTGVRAQSAVPVGWVRPAVSEPASSISASDVAAPPSDAADAATPVLSTAVELLPVQTIEANSAQLWARATVGNPAVTGLFFVYAYDQTEIDQVNSRATYDAVQARTDRGVRTYRFTSSIKPQQRYYHNAYDLAPDTTYYVRFCAELTDRLRCSRVSSFQTPPRVFAPGDARPPVVRTSQPTHHSASSVTVSAAIDMRDVNDGLVFLVYGESRELVQDSRGQAYRDIDQAGDRLTRE